MNLGNALGIPSEVYRYTPDIRLILSSCRLGLEFEFEGVRVGLPDEGWATYWEAKADRSLHDNGMEFVFKKPWFGTDAVEAVLALCAWAKKNKFKVSLRTGLHAHVDVRDLTRKQLSVLLCLYALFERAIYRFVGNGREDNVFCMPWHKSDQMAVHAYNICSDHTNIKLSSEALRNEKYGGLNLDSLARFGSIEFRHAITTADTDWVFRWINICLSFKRAAQKLDTTPLAVIHNLSAIGVEAFAKQVFEDQFEHLWYPAMETDVWATGVETALAVMPMQVAILDRAALSWFAPTEDEGKKTALNPSFKAYVESQKPKKSVGVEPLLSKEMFAFAPVKREDDAALLRALDL